MLTKGLNEFDWYYGGLMEGESKVSVDAKSQKL